jgi:hypothetical protein
LLPVSDNDRAGRIRYQYLSQFGDGADLPAELLHRMAADIARQCGNTLLKAHRFHSSPVHLGWAADYTPAEVPAARGVLAGAAARSSAGGTPATRGLAAEHTRHGRALLHLPPDTRDFTGRAEQVGEVSRLVAAATMNPGTALPIVCLSGQAGIGKTTLAIHVAHRRARMYRAQLADRQMLVVLDNAANEAQVRPLLPGPEPGWYPGRRGRSPGSRPG